MDTYGVPRYREINPGIFAIIFFPFLFGVMFGDIAHGMVILLLGVYLLKRDLLKTKTTNLYSRVQK